jgi:hypothetical protein
MEQQTRTYRWADPHEMHKRGRALSGLEFIRLLTSDELGRTPMMATLAYAFVAVDEATSSSSAGRDRLLAHATAGCLLFPTDF